MPATPLTPSLHPLDAPPLPRSAPGVAADLRSLYDEVRTFSQGLCASLDPEDLVAQSMPDCSPLKWHLAHTTWFFEEMVLEPFSPNGARYERFHPRYAYLFNSYYNAVGDRHARSMRGVLTRPTAAEIETYREYVDHAMHRLLERDDLPRRAEMRKVVELGLHHEQQHQELMLTDLKHLFSLNALEPAYREPLASSRRAASSQGWVQVPEGIHEIGHDGRGFAFDNEGPRHRVFVEGAELADRLVTNGEFLAFIEDGGYQRPELWLDAGWATVQSEAWSQPFYWRRTPEGWAEFTLAGTRELALAEPVSHVSYIEADAFARWAGARLPTETEWEVVCRSAPVEGNFVDAGRLHPAPASALASVSSSRVRQAFGDVWEWTSSGYSAYPGYRALEGALGEYNGKFMCGQLVLRGGSCATSRSHARPTYRNFFRAPDRWQFSGLRLARDPS